MPVVNVKGMGLMRIAQQSQPQATAGIQSRVNKQNAFDDRVQGVLSGIGSQIADVAINDEGGLNNPAQLKAALDSKFQEVRGFVDMVTEGLTPTQKAAFLTMGVNGLGDITGLAADMEMYITDPESRTWFNGMMSGVGVAGGAMSVSPSMAAMLPIIRKNIDAWHGSPHKFDNFSMSNIGTGEGAQAYGHGLYFAESPDVAKDYQAAFAQNAYQNNDKNYARALQSNLSAGEFDAFEHSVRAQGGNATPESLADAFFERHKDWQPLKDTPSEYENIRKFAEDYQANLPDAQLYNVNLNVSPDELLDWDAPFSEQSKSVQDALSPYMDGPEVFLSNGKSISNPTGKQIYYNVVPNATNQADASKRMQELGVPGIRYLDGDSRSAGEGTRNFVIFDDSLVDIKTRNGEALTPVQREAAVAELTPVQRQRSFSPEEIAELGYDPTEIANRYPERIPPVLTQDKRTGNEFLQKVLSPEELAVQKARKGAQRDINAGNYTPYFEVAERYNVDPTKYDIQGNTLTDAMPKRQDTIDKLTARFNTPEIKQNLRNAYRAGDSPEARDWYAVGQLEDEFINELGPEIGRDMFRERFATAMAATTGGADPTANLLTANYVNFLRSKGVTELPNKSFDLSHPIGGRYIGGNMKMADKVLNQGVGLSTSGQPKRANFERNFLGDSSAATIDEQMSHLYEPKLNAPPSNAYGIMEQTLREVAEEIGVDPMNLQDVGWAGAKGTDGKAMIVHVNEAIERTARVTGKNRDDIVRDSFVNATHPLYGLATAGLLGTTAALREDRNREPDI